MASLIRHFWGWDTPVLENAVRYLLRASTAGRAALDLAGTLVIVPTAEAGRRLKEALARANPAGVLIPWVWTAEQALLPQASRKDAATSLQSQMAWLQALEKVDVHQLKALFPLLPEEQGWSWNLEMARLLAELNSLLGAGGLTFSEVAEQMEQDGARWQDLALIESAYSTVLAQVELRDSQLLKREGAQNPQLPEGVTQVLVLAAPDLPPLFQQWAPHCGAEVVVAIQAPEALAHTFDDIGRPLPEYWGEDSPVGLPFSEAELHLQHDASAQAEKSISLLRDLAPRGQVAVGVGDPEVGAVLEEKLALEGVRIFEPGGVAPTEVGLWHVLQQMRTLLASGSWRAFATLLRVPAVRACWGKEVSGIKLLKEVDDFAMEHMPVTVDHARELVVLVAGETLLPPVIERAQQMIQELRTLPLLKAARSLLIHLYGEHKFAPNSPRDQMTAALADTWLGCCREIEEEIHRFGLRPKAEESFALSLESLSREVLSEPRGEVDLTLQGWLELLWEPAPNLVVAGLNEEHVPGIVIAHPFLPDGLRQKLGLPNQSTRFARDAYTLACLAEQRLPNGSLHLLCGQWSERGDALRPSRLLFLCQDSVLPQRVKHLFPKEDATGTHTAEPVRTLAWKLTPRVVAPLVENISPSRIRSYLECPFRDYLNNGLHMDSVEVAKRELAANEFGTLVHHALQQLAEHSQMKVCSDAEVIADFLIDQALERARALYGNKSAPLINLQLESLKQRLRHAAETEAAERENGWIIYAPELSPTQTPLLIDGAMLRCKVDRIDRHASTGQLRVIDYKTADKIIDPQMAHTRKLSNRSVIADSDEWKCFELKDGTRYQWKDLQLPLYAAALQANGLTPNAVGYFTLPKSVQDTKVLTWSEFTEEWVDHALACAREVVKRLREGRFWPPSEKAYDRGFDDLFLGDIEGSTNWNGPKGDGT